MTGWPQDGDGARSRPRDIPATEALLGEPRLAAAAERLGRALVKQAVHDAQARARRGELDVAAIADHALATLPDTASSLSAMFNATGVMLHTNLGRAPLSPAAVAALAAAAGYVDVEFDLTTGRRGVRGRPVLDALLAAVPAAEAALVVNNGAAALVLAATVLAAGREVVVSRGEMVEIGDGFRLPDLLVSTGARLCEVGTTNRTRLADYAAAVGPDTGFVLKVHPSNFTIAGFTHAVSVRELATLGVPVVADIGSGLLRPEPRLPAEPDAATWLAEGADVVTASGDKLLGGPQAGILLGRQPILDTLRRHPLARALRVGKLTLAALEASLVGPPTPTRLALCAGPEVLRERADRLARRLTDRGIGADVVACEGRVGGGGAPGVALPGWAVRTDRRTAAALRRGRPAVIARVERDHCLIDLRCVPTDADELVLDAIIRAAGSAGTRG